MGKASDSSTFRAIPSVERILSASSFAPLVGEFGRERVKESVVAHLASVRAARVAWDEDTALQSVAESLAAATASSLRRVINASGVIHSAGKSITFTRDALGRITQITDPNGNAQSYTYDSNGDLVTFTDRENHATTFTYNSDHHLLTIVDARGVSLLTNQYDAAGRLIGQTDAFNKSQIYDHDVAGRCRADADRRERRRPK